jgi:hypothetical protein
MSTWLRYYFIPGVHSKPSVLNGWFIASSWQLNLQNLSSYLVGHAARPAAPVDQSLNNFKKSRFPAKNKKPCLRYPSTKTSWTVCQPVRPQVFSTNSSSRLPVPAPSNLIAPSHLSASHSGLNLSIWFRHPADAM